MLLVTAVTPAIYHKMSGTLASRAQSEGLTTTSRHDERFGASYRPRADVTSSAQAPSIPHSPHTLYTELCRLSDTVVAIGALLFVFALATGDKTAGAFDQYLLARFTLKNLLLASIFAFAWQEIFYLLGLDHSESRMTAKDELARIAIACAAGCVLALGLPNFSSTHSFGVVQVACMWPIAFVLAASSRHAMRHIGRVQRTRSRRRVVIVGSGPRALALYRQLCTGANASCELVGFVDSSTGYMAPELMGRMLAELESLESVLMKYVVDEVLIALPIKSHYAEIQRAIEDCERVGIEAKYLADVFRCSLVGPRFGETSRFPVVSVKVVKDDYRLLFKRLLDLVGATVGLVVLSPLLVLIALAVRVTSPGPVIFGQERYGLRKRRFRMYKFRTMVQNAEALQPALEDRNEAAGPVFKIANDPRITRLGRFLRRTSLDELPQLLNVLKGDMSLVGPRPLPLRDVHHFRDGWLMRRFSVAPGLTCLWQISGRSNLRFDDWIALDLQYIDKWSLGLDLWILLRTIPAVLRGAGAA